MKGNRQELLKELEFVQPGLGKDTFVEGTHLVRFHKKRIWTFNHEVGATAPLPRNINDLIGATNGEKLYQFISKATGSVLEFSEKDGTMQVLSRRAATKASEGAAKVSLPWLPDEKIPHTIPDTWVDVPQDFAQALLIAASCCSEHLTRPVLTCVHVRQDRIEGADGMRAIQYQLKKPFEQKYNFLLPQIAANIVARTTGINQICVEKKNVWFRSEEKTAEETKERYLFCSTMEGEYNDIDAHLKWAPKSQEFKLPFHLLDPILDRAKIFSAEDATEGERYVDVSVVGDKLYVKAEGDISRYEEWIPVKGIPEFSISMAARYLLNLVSEEGDIDCALSSNNERIWVKHGRWQFVSMIHKPKK